MSTKDLFVYIDGENLNGSTSAIGYHYVDYKKLYNWLKTGKSASRVYLYASFYKGDTDGIAKLDELEKLGYIVRRKQIVQYLPEDKEHELTCPKCKQKTTHIIQKHGKSKGNCDSELTLDVINDVVRRKYKSMIVFSGDGDFARMYEYVAETMKRSVLVYSPLKGRPGLRTSLSIKSMGNSGVIKVESLEGIVDNFGTK